MSSDLTKKDRMSAAPFVEPRGIRRVLTASTARPLSDDESCGLAACREAATNDKSASHQICGIGYSRMPARGDFGFQPIGEPEALGLWTSPFSDTTPDFVQRGAGRKLVTEALVRRPTMIRTANANQKMA
jgi:hypothetical protein